MSKSSLLALFAEAPGVSGEVTQTCVPFPDHSLASCLVFSCHRLCRKVCHAGNKHKWRMADQPTRLKCISVGTTMCFAMLCQYFFVAVGLGKIIAKEQSCKKKKPQKANAYGLSIKSNGLFSQKVLVGCVSLKKKQKQNILHQNPFLG